jgi:heme/copper-type cytochrome/quinol oxidase subunit 1
MSTTEIRPEARTEQVPDAEVPPPSGIAGVIGSGDHKVIGRVFIGFALLLGAASGMALALGMLGNLSGGGLFSSSVNLRLFTAGQFGLVFGFALPLFVGLGMVIVPLQVGASSIAFPRAAALSLWLWLAGALSLLVAYAVGGGVGGDNQRAIDLTFTSLGMLVVGLLLGAVCIATTVISLRAPGMSLDRVPMFTFSMLAATGVWLLTWPVLLGNLILLRVDLANGQFGFGAPDAQWPAVSWSFMQPQIYVLAIPVLGVLGDAIATLTGRRQPSRNVMLVAIGAFAALSLGAWAQLGQPGDIWTEPFFVLVSFAIVLPILGAAGGFGSMVAAGKPKPSAPLVAATAAMILLVLAWWPWVRPDWCWRPWLLAPSPQWPTGRRSWLVVQLLDRPFRWRHWPPWAVDFSGVWASSWRAHRDVLLPLRELWTHLWWWR